MRNEHDVRENLEWLSANCPNYRAEEQAAVVNQLATLLWVLGAERTAAETEAQAIWARSREHRRQRPADY